MKLTSPAFEQGKSIPAKYTCDGENVNPELSIFSVPDKAKSLVLIMDDPDIPEEAKRNFNITVWDHWIVFNIPPSTTRIDEDNVPPGVQGINTRQALGYRGPCPPDREHRYFFRLYALDAMLNLKEGAVRKQVEQAMLGHVIAETVLMGTYARVPK